MPEHVHEWGTRHKRHNIYGDVIEVWCPVCGETMPWKDAKARLNATERLSAERARQLSDDLVEAHQTPSGALIELYHDDIDAIKAYADTLEGK